MVTKSSPGSAKTAATAEAVRESSHQIWLAGLGAFTKAQQEGSKVFDALVQEGLAMQRKAQTAAEVRLTEAGQKVSHLAQDLSQRASSQWSQLEGLFEDRVARAMERLGMPTAQQVQALQARVAELEAQLKARKVSPGAQKVTPARKAAIKTPRKTVRTAR
jgi:poly(hydroxyalkanoate) granule-associated protein